MKEVPLAGGLVALVDDEDYDYLARFKWHAFGTLIASADGRDRA